MIHSIPLILSLYACVFGGKATVNKDNTINPVIGDVSYVNKYGGQPSTSTNETDRIKTHLEYVEQRLLAKDVSRLPEATKQKRKKAIALLHEYRTAGNFPKNYDHPGRRPCFIDKDGNICAVGYLVEQTAGRAAAEKINATHQYDEIKDMNDPEIIAWVASSGLTKEECAMIQPTYGWQNEVQLPLSYSITTSVFSGANLAFTGTNISQCIRGKKTTTLGVVALASGSAQTLLGALNLNNNGYNSSKGQIASVINIALGGTTVISSLINILVDKQPRVKNTSVSLTSFPTVKNEPTLGFTLTRKL